MTKPTDEAAALARDLKGVDAAELADRIRKLGALERVRLRRLVDPDALAVESEASRPAAARVPVDPNARPVWEREARRSRRVNTLVHWAVYLLIATATVAVAFTGGSKWETGRSAAQD